MTLLFLCMLPAANLLSFMMMMNNIHCKGRSKAEAKRRHHGDRTTTKKKQSKATTTPQEKFKATVMATLPAQLKGASSKGLATFNGHPNLIVGFMMLMAFCLLGGGEALRYGRHEGGLDDAEKNSGMGWGGEVDDNSWKDSGEVDGKVFVDSGEDDGMPVEDGGEDDNENDKAGAKEKTDELSGYLFEYDGEDTALPILSSLAVSADAKGIRGSVNKKFRKSDTNKADATAAVIATKGNVRRELQCTEGISAWHPKYSVAYSIGYCELTNDCNSRAYETELQCCENAYGTQTDGYCISVSELPNPPTKAPTKSGVPDFYYPNQSSEGGFCINTLPVPRRAPTYPTMLACCNEEFAEQISGEYSCVYLKPVIYNIMSCQWQEGDWSKNS